jgi:hypothetical protein
LLPTGPTSSPAAAPSRKNVTAWRGYNRRRWELEKEVLPLEEAAPFVCECTSATCLQCVDLTMPEFESAHMCPSWCAVRPGHTLPADGSSVVARHRRFWVVELQPTPLARPGRDSSPPV